MKPTNHKTFCLGDILSVITHRLVTDRGFEALYDLCGFMTGESLFTHQLPRAIIICGHHLEKQFPQLAGFTADQLNEGTHVRAYQSRQEVVEAWLQDLTRKYGDSFEVAPLPEGSWETKDPLEELVEMRDGAPVVEQLFAGDNA